MANVTRREVLTKAMSLADVFSTEEMEVLNKMLKALDNKSSKPTKASLENIKVRNEILALITCKRPRLIDISIPINNRIISVVITIINK